mmetsp:Transcript_31033/g.82505  ORF Transcript_31033/g.82505 Transcript_31033/m.82505 type:complete len:248 (-) Transcript_31033:1650-2393(-)
MSRHLPHDKFDHALLFRAEVLCHFLLHPGAQLLLSDVVLVHCVPVNVVSKGLLLVGGHLLDQPPHFIILQLRLSIQSHQWPVLPRHLHLNNRSWRTRRRHGTIPFSDFLLNGLEELQSCSFLHFFLLRHALSSLLLLCLSHLTLLLLFSLSFLLFSSSVFLLQLLSLLPSSLLLLSPLLPLLFLPSSRHFFNLLLLFSDVLGVILSFHRSLSSSLISVPLPLTLVGFILAPMEISVYELAFLTLRRL